MDWDDVFTLGLFFATADLVWFAVAAALTTGAGLVLPEVWRAMWIAYSD